jgi:hypothetical protein
LIKTTWKTEKHWIFIIRHDLTQRSLPAEAIRKFLIRKRSSIVSIAVNDLQTVKNMKNPQMPPLVGKSLFCFGPDNYARNFCAAIINWRYFESVSLF